MAAELKKGQGFLNFQRKNIENFLPFFTTKIIQMYVCVYVRVIRRDIDFVPRFLVHTRTPNHLSILRSLGKGRSKLKNSN